MTDKTLAATKAAYEDVPVAELGSIAIRVVVLPRKNKKGATAGAPVALVDAEDDEAFLQDTNSSPLSSYLESSRGKRCCVFLVNGQRQDALDSSFIMQDLGFKYLRNRMMIVVDVDGLNPAALGKLMQGSRQQFYRGDIWYAILRRVVGTLKSDPDLIRLEEEAEEQVSELETGDEKVKQTLDQLIDNHHDSAVRSTAGAGSFGDGESDQSMGLKTVVQNGVVSLLPPEQGKPADYPVLVSQPASATVRLRPGVEREISVKALPSGAWPALAELVVAADATVPELRVKHDKQADQCVVALLFKQPVDFDTDQYPVRAKLMVTARFNGVSEPRQVELSVVVKPDEAAPDVELLDIPTKLAVSSREPIKIRMGDSDSHVRLRWDGKDELLNAPSAPWKLRAALRGAGGQQPSMSFSEASKGRFSLLVSPRAEWKVGDKLTFEVFADGPAGSSLPVVFLAEVAEPRKKPDDPEEQQPRLVDSSVQVGAVRRPPYELKYITRDEYETIECWGGADWNDADAGCFKSPTERAPLTLIINKDMSALRDYRKYLTKRYAESEVERRVSRYTSHIAFHLYQMYQSSSEQQREENPDAVDNRRRQEIQRVAMTLIKLMEVAR